MIALCSKLIFVKASSVLTVEQRGTLEMFKLPENKLIEMLYSDGHHEEENVTINSWYQIPESKKYLDITTTKNGKKKVKTIVLNGMSLEELDTFLSSYISKQLV